MQMRSKSYVVNTFGVMSELRYKNYVRITLESCIRFSLGNYVIKPNGNKKIRNHYVMVYEVYIT